MKVRSEPQIPHSQESHPFETGCGMPTTCPPWARQGTQTWDITECQLPFLPIKALLEPDGGEAAGDGEDVGRGPEESALLLVIIDLFYICKTSKAQKVFTDVFFLIKTSLFKRP